jgi:uncharacterized repeat protein (TIGR03803 family)
MIRRGGRPALLNALFEPLPDFTRGNRIHGATGTVKTLYNFCSQGGTSCTDGYAPETALIQATDGNFYGTTGYGGANGNYGTVFSLSVGLGPLVETQPTSGAVRAAHPAAQSRY